MVPERSRDTTLRSDEPHGAGGIRAVAELARQRYLGGADRTMSASVDENLGPGLAEFMCDGCNVDWR